MRLQEYLNSQLLKKNFGSAVDLVYFGFNCINPSLNHQLKDFETGVVIHKKYTRSNHCLELEIKLNHRKLSMISTENQLFEMVKEALLKSRLSVKELNIKGFHSDVFYDELKILLEDRYWLSLPYTEQNFDFRQSESKLNHSKVVEKVPESLFWSLVEDSRIKSLGDYHKQIEILTEELSTKDEKVIIGFELTLRELLAKAYHYNVMAVQKIVEKNVSDDSFLYFRSKLIMYGRIAFEQAIDNPNYIVESIDPKADGELLLSVPDSAFTLKFGNGNDKVSPSDYASQIIDYNLINYPIQGTRWEELDLSKRFSKLWKKYR